MVKGNCIFDSESSAVRLPNLHKAAFAYYTNCRYQEPTRVWGGGKKGGGETAQTRIQKWCTYWFAGALCTPASNCAGSTLYDIVLVFPSCNCALPAVPCCVEIVKGVSICQHSSVEALLAAPSAVIFSCRAAADGSSTASSTTVERSRVNVCILACETLQ